MKRNMRNVWLSCMTAVLLLMLAAGALAASRPLNADTASLCDDGKPCDYLPGNCVSPPICIRCGETSGELGSHRFEPINTEGTMMCVFCTMTTRQP